jgi:hypothetical protein
MRLAPVLCRAPGFRFSGGSDTGRRAGIGRARAALTLEPGQQFVAVIDHFLAELPKRRVCRAVQSALFRSPRRQPDKPGRRARIH